MTHPQRLLPPDLGSATSFSFQGFDPILQARRFLLCPLFPLEPCFRPMAFVNEVVSDADIDKYGLPFKKGSGRYWTRDADRDMYLWGGKGGNPAFGEDIVGYSICFYLDKQL